MPRRPLGAPLAPLLLAASLAASLAPPPASAESYTPRLRWDTVGRPGAHPDRASRDAWPIGHVVLPAIRRVAVLDISGSIYLRDLGDGRLVASDLRRDDGVGPSGARLWPLGWDRLVLVGHHRVGLDRHAPARGPFHSFYDGRDLRLIERQRGPVAFADQIPAREHLHGPGSALALHSRFDVYELAPGLPPQRREARFEVDHPSRAIPVRHPRGVATLVEVPGQARLELPGGQTLLLHEGEYERVEVTVSPDGAQVAVSAQDPGTSAMVTWFLDVASGRVVGGPLVESGTRPWNWHQAFSPDGRLFMTGLPNPAAPGFTSVWDWRRGVSVAQVPCCQGTKANSEEKAVWVDLFPGDEDEVAVLTLDSEGTMRVWDLHHSSP